MIPPSSRPALLALFLVSLSAAPLHAEGGKAAPQLLGKFGFWNAYSLTENDQPVCYMSIAAPAPKANTGKKSKRGTVTLMITHRPAENSTDVVSYSAGLKFKPASEVVATAGKKQFNLFTQGDTAWSRDAATDHALAATIRYAPNITILGTASNGSLIEDLVHLKGASAAYKAIGKACGIAVEEEPKAKPASKPLQKKLPLRKH